jgi:signal peptide peptidase SppA
MQFEAAMNNKLALDMFEEDKEDKDKEEMQLPMNCALICVDGIIGKHLSLMETLCGGIDIETISNELDMHMSNPEIKNIIIRFSTPGGTVTGVPELADKISRYSKMKNIVGVCDTQCCSAGIWLASQCTSFYCSPSSDIGSVGVYSIFIDETQALEDMGIKVVPISSGQFKLMGASFRTMSQEEIAILQKEINDTHAEFKASVKIGRPIIDEKDMEGQVFNGKEAVYRGFADGNIQEFKDIWEFFN